ncbi:transcriptional regulator, HxlR family [Pseudonocardia thermophila]|uniref:Transcriptional regulator, HxlR family n=1 Tax=Pseudonocardia thermophila TaxID=1848 RepID=A0A1M7B3W2_PSETH|nr:helix-turn-helix domain-containing protein [Pseudonocardia thermophila]SHL49705.1 transcriptional regulator, HxlR family [Pseudonocardia thermophila]
MLGRTYDREVCSAARALEVVGERWSLLILRDAAFRGLTRFSQLQEALGIAPNVLSARLEHFVASGLMTVDRDEGHPRYALTPKGRELVKVVLALTEWGDRWAAPDGPPIEYGHEGCTGTVRLVTCCDTCGGSPPVEDIVARRTPAMEKALARRGRTR